MSESDKHIQKALDESDVPADAPKEEPLAPDIPADRTRQFTHTNFSRMRTTWRDSEQPAMAVVQAEAERIIRGEFRMVQAVLGRIRKTVRIPLADGKTGEIFLDADGGPRWELDEYDLPAEDWSRLTGNEELVKDLLWTVTTWLYEWEQQSTKLWAEAMYAKVNWEQAFAKGFLSPPGEQITGKPTIDDRTQAGHRYSADDRYFAVFRSALSRRADAAVRSMTRLQWLLEKTVDRR